MNEKELFIAALDLQSAAERRQFVADRCGQDLNLLSKVLGLLEAVDLAGSFLDRPATPLGEFPLPEETATVPPSPNPMALLGNTKIGPYKLLEVIGEGGMGTVYMAEQTEPIRRRVALKMVKPGMNTAQVLARFEAERQALAMMEHPNIAKVLDAGATEAGLPYFVMELVRGVPITGYCDANRFNLSERLNLFVAVCEAVQHAHQKGIIHRDLKPSNVLVASFDGRPVPKVIDFGIAKAIAGNLTDRTMFTGFGHILGTLEYMSPEQAEFNSLDVDTRADIYSLGVLLYELLTGTPPLTRQRLNAAALDEALRLVREEDPPLPSHRLSSSHDTLASIATQRQTDPRALTRSLRGDLDWIAMKALEKDRSRRYATAVGLMEDVRRFLRNDPIEARPPSAGYVTRKFLRKHWRVATTVGVLLAIGLFALLGVSLSLLESRHQRKLADDARAKAVRSETDALRAADLERTARLDESRQRRRAEAISQYLVQALRSPDPALDGRKIPVVDVLQQAEQSLHGEFADDPVTRAVLLDALGQTYSGLGLPDQAMSVLRAARQAIPQDATADSSLRIQIQNHLGLAERDAGQLAEGLETLRETLELATQSLGADHADTLSSEHNYALLLKANGRLPEASARFETLLERSRLLLGPDDRRTLETANSLAGSYAAQRDPQKALPLYEETLRRRSATLPEGHPDVLMSLNNLARNYQDLGRLEEAIPLFHKSLNLCRQHLGDDHPDTLLLVNNLAGALSASGKHDEALTHFQEVVRMRQEKLGPDHPDTLVSQQNLAVELRHLGRVDETLAILQEVLTRRRATLGQEHPGTQSSLRSVSTALALLKRWSEAEPLLRESLEFQRRQVPVDNRRLVEALTKLAECLQRLDRSAEAEPLLKEAERLKES